MKIRIALASLLAILALAPAAHAQTTPSGIIGSAYPNENIHGGDKWTPLVDQWNALMAAKQDTLTSSSVLPNGVSIGGSGTGHTAFSSANSGSTNYTLTVPAINGTLITSGDTGTVTSGMLAAGAANVAAGGLYGATANSIPYGGGPGMLPNLAPFSLNASAVAAQAGHTLYGDGVHDDGPAIRAAYAACVNGNFHRVFLPVPSVEYLISSLDTSGLGGIVIGDGQKITATVSITSGQPTLTASTSVFTSSMVGASIDVPGAGTSGGTLTTTISAYNSGTSLTLASNAGTTLSSSSQTLQIGHANTCDFDGEALNTGWNFNIGNNGSGYGVHIVLGNGLNRPLVFVTTKAATPSFSHVILDGNGGNQTGWAGGPSSKLYTVQVDDGSTYPEGAINFDRSIAINGYNGNVYVGSGRGSGSWRDFISLYGGRGSSDYCIYLNGYDLSWSGQSGVGSCNGNGVIVAEGSQYWINGLAIWLSSYDGLDLNGGAVGYFSASNLNLQDNGCNGVSEANYFPGNTYAGHHLSNVTFDGNNQNNTGCSDINAGSSLLSIANVGFIGNSAGATSQRALYNVGGSGKVQLANVQWGVNPNLGGSISTAFQNPSVIRCSNCNGVDFTFTPTLTTSGTVGTPTYSAQQGRYTVSNNLLTLNLSIATSAWSGSPTGELEITGLPLFSSNSAPIGMCAVSNYSGWTAQTGYTTMTGVIGQASNTVYLYETGSGKTQGALQVGEIVPATLSIQMTCTYPIPN
jgi:hypothetical protein